MLLGYQGTCNQPAYADFPTYAVIEEACLRSIMRDRLFESVSRSRHWLGPTAAYPTTATRHPTGHLFVWHTVPEAYAGFTRVRCWWQVGDVTGLHMQISTIKLDDSDLKIKRFPPMCTIYMDSCDPTDTEQLQLPLLLYVYALPRSTAYCVYPARQQTRIINGNTAARKP